MGLGLTEGGGCSLLAGQPVAVYVAENDHLEGVDLGGSAQMCFYRPGALTAAVASLA